MTTLQDARDVLQRRFIGPEELCRFGWPLSFHGVQAQEIVPSADVLERCAGSHVLVYTPARDASGESITRERMLGWISEADSDKHEKARARLNDGEVH